MIKKHIFDMLYLTYKLLPESDRINNNAIFEDYEDL
jgi:hypothetical protein